MKSKLITLYVEDLLPVLSPFQHKTRQVCFKHKFVSLFNKKGNIMQLLRNVPGVCCCNDSVLISLILFTCLTVLSECLELLGN